ncbi:MAG: Gfo/Idh/MocA family oxidoreductase [Vicinamibacteria bacterium]|nr:Gfo/Idh/MocA family oxidoreductase [Vicinamibacteria bacterium]
MSTLAPHRLRFGVLSTARIGWTSVCPAIHASRNAELGAIASRDLGQAGDFAKEALIPRHYGSYDELLQDPEIDAVYIPLPNSLHLEWAIKAAERKKHVLCEKPLALTVGECLEMQAAADKSDVRLMEAFMYRFHHRTQRLLDMARGGVVGDLRMIRSAFTFRLTRPDNIRLRADLGGGALMDVGCYCVDISRRLAGTLPVEAQAWSTQGSSGVDTQFAGSLRFENGLVAQFDCALDIERREFVEVVGVDGTLVASEAFVSGPGGVEIVERHGRGPETRHAIAGEDPYQRMVEHFADAVLTGEPVRYGVADAAGTMAIIEALKRSAAAGGRPMPVEDQVQ